MSDEKCPSCGTPFDVPIVYGTVPNEDGLLPHGPKSHRRLIGVNVCQSCDYNELHDLRRQLAAKDADNERLRAVVEAMAGGDLTLSQTTDGTWQWAGEPADDMFYRWHGSFPSAADAGLAALAK